MTTAQKKNPGDVHAPTLEAAMRSLAPILEKKRKKTYGWLLAISMLLVVVIAVVMAIYSDSMSNATVAAVSFCLVPCVILYQILNRSYMNAARDIITGHLEEGLSYTYNENGVFSVRDVSKHLIVPPHDRSEIEDGLQGIYRDVRVSVQSASFNGLHQKSGYRSKLVEGRTMHAMMVRLHLNRALGAHTVAMPPQITRALFAVTFNGFQNIKPTNAKFEKSYEVLTTDTVEAKVALSTGFTDQLLDTVKSLHAGWMLFSMISNEILIIFHGNHLDIQPDPLWKPVTALGLFRITQPLEAVYKIVDAVKSNHQISG